MLDFDHVNATRFPDFAGVRGIEAVLGPGDLLYMPAYWFHNVRAMSFSASVNIWVLAEDTQLAKSVAIKGMPFGSDVPQAHLAPLAAEYIRRLTARVYATALGVSLAGACCAMRHGLASPIVSRAALTRARDCRRRATSPGRPRDHHPHAVQDG